MAVDKTALAKFLSDRGFEVSDSMDRFIDLWKSWYKGTVEDFHNYQVFNGSKKLDVQRASLQLGKSMPEQLSNLLFNEKCEMAIDDGSRVNKEDLDEVETDGVSGGNATDAFVKLIFDRNDMHVRLNESQERKAVFGTVVYVPYFANGTIKFNIATADNLIPLSWESGIINELCVYSPQMIKGDEYLYVQLFVIDKQSRNEEGKPTYNIENLLLKGSTTDTHGGKSGIFSYVQVEDFSKIPGYEDLEPQVDTGSARRPFVVDRLNISNNIDPDSPLGLSVFANAIDSMKLCDIVYDSLRNEFVLGRKRVMISTEAINAMNGNPVFDPNEMVYYQLPPGVTLDGKPFVYEMDFTIRSEEHERSLQNALNTFSYQCGFGDNFFRYQNGSMATATQVISENNVMFRTLKKHEVILEAVIVDLIRLVIEIGIRHNLAEGLNPDPEITISFDDSIIEDKDKEIQRRMAEVSGGLLRSELYLAWRYGVTVKEAQSMMPSMQDGNEEEGLQ